MSVTVESATTEAELLRRLEEAFQVRHSDSERGARIGIEAVKEAEARGWRHAEAVARNVVIYTQAVEAEDSLIDRLTTIYEVLGEFSDDLNQARAGDLLATVLESVGDYSGALRYAERVLELTRASGDQLFHGYAVSSLVGIFTATGDLQMAEKKARYGLSVAEQVGNPRLQARLHLRLARVHRHSGALEDAELELHRALTLGKAAESPFGQADALTELGRVEELRGHFEPAMRHLEEARATADLEPEVWRIIGPRTLLAAARIHLEEHRYEAALSALNELEPLAEDFQMKPVLAEAAEMMARIYEEMGRPEDALAALRRHLALREEVMEGESQRAVKRFQVRMELQAARKDAEIHRLKFVELEAMQTQLLESERMAAVGGLAAGLAHEMNTPLGVVRSNLDTSQRALARLREELELTGRADAIVRALTSAQATSASALERLESLVRSVRRFTRLDEAERQRFDLCEELEATLDLARATAPSGVQLRSELRPLPALFGWPSRLNQAFLTLMLNAVEAIGNQGEVVLEAVAEPDHIVVTIKDDGPGIPVDIQPRLFELTLESHGPRAHFRVGMATVRSIITRHSGTIEFTSTPEAGTVFTITLPRAAS